MTHGTRNGVTRPYRFDEFSGDFFVLVLDLKRVAAVRCMFNNPAGNVPQYPDLPSQTSEHEDEHEHEARGEARPKP